MHKTTLRKRICGDQLPNGQRCNLTWGEHPRDEKQLPINHQVKS
jgi:hypothetical protein